MTTQRVLVRFRAFIINMINRRTLYTGRTLLNQEAKVLVRSGKLVATDKGLKPSNLSPEAEKYLVNDTRQDLSVSRISLDWSKPLKNLSSFNWRQITGIRLTVFGP